MRSNSRPEAIRSRAGRAAVLAACGAVWIAAAAQAAAPPLVLQGGRFEVQATWRTPGGQTGVGTPSALTGETGTFWFFSPSNTELVVKVLDACSNPSERFWVFAGGLTDVEVEMTVTDTATGDQKRYHNPAGIPFEPIQDTGAFATCNAAPRCGQGTFADVGDSPHPDPELENLAVLVAGTAAVPQAVYDRVVADVASIRAQRPVDPIFSPRHDPSSLLVTLDSAADPAWGCLNRWYRVQGIHRFVSSNLVELNFAGILNTAKIAADYAALPGVRSAEPDELITVATPPPFDSLCASADGSTIYYFVRPYTTVQPVEYYTSEPGSPPVGRGAVTSSSAVSQRAVTCYNERTTTWL